MRDIDTFVVHYSATPPQWCCNFPTLAAAVEEIRRWHVDGNGWSDIGYHFVIGIDGDVVLGRPVERIGAHVGGHNLGSIGICWIGGLDQSGSSADTRTPAQTDALYELIEDLKNEYGKAKLVTGHRDLAPGTTECPGYDVDPDYRSWRARQALQRPLDLAPPTLRPTLPYRVARWLRERASGGVWPSGS